MSNMCYKDEDISPYRVATLSAGDDMSILN